MVRARLTAIDAYLDQHAKAREGFAVPAMWGPEHQAELEQGFESLGSFFEQVDSLLDDDTCRFALAHGEIVSDLGPMLSLSSHRTNVLCARALTEFEGPDGSRLAARRLGQALDLIRLGDDGRDLGYLISTTEEDRVLSALRRLLADERADGLAFRRELDDRLERISRVDRVESVLSNSVAEYVECERGHSESSWAKPWSRYEQWRERNRVSEGLATSVQLARTTGVNSRALYLSKLGATDNPAWVNGWMAADGSHMRKSASTSRAEHWRSPRIETRSAPPVVASGRDLRGGHRPRHRAVREAR
jgi:hypothetical protein